jgi:hypothetical protein
MWRGRRRRHRCCYQRCRREQNRKTHRGRRRGASARRSSVGARAGGGALSSQTASVQKKCSTALLLAAAAGCLLPSSPPPRHDTAHCLVGGSSGRKAERGYPAETPQLRGILIGSRLSLLVGRLMDMPTTSPPPGTSPFPASLGLHEPSGFYAALPVAPRPAMIVRGESRHDAAGLMSGGYDWALRLQKVQPHERPNSCSPLLGGQVRRRQPHRGALLPRLPVPVESASRQDSQGLGYRRMPPAGTVAVAGQMVPSAGFGTPSRWRTSAQDLGHARARSLRASGPAGLAARADFQGIRPSDDTRYQHQALQGLKGTNGHRSSARVIPPRAGSTCSWHS